MLSGCVYSENDRAEELANATPTPLRTPDPDPDSESEATPQPSVVAQPDESEPQSETTENVEPGEPGWVVVQEVENSLNVRSGPGTENDVITRADLGTTLATTGQTALVDGSQWVEVVLDDETDGWVHSNFVVSTVQPTPTPLPTPTPAATGDNLVVDSVDGTRLRTEPSTSGTVIRRIDHGTVVIPTGATSVDEDGRRWVEVRDGAETAWANGRFLKSP